MPLDKLAIDASRMVSAGRTGTENYSVEIIRSLARLPDVPPITLYTRSSQATAHVPNVISRAIGPRRLWTHAGLSRAIRTDRPDALFVPSHVVPLIHPRATVVTVHDLGYLHEPESHPRRQRLELDWTTRWNARSARRIIAISGQTRSDLIEHYNVSPERVTVVHHGVDHTRFFPRADSEIAPVLERLGIRTPYLLFVSTVQPRKNVTRIVEAFEQIDIPELSLVIAGKSGWLSDPIENRIQASPVANRIRRTGRVDDEDLPFLYSGAEAFVLPSLFEGFGLGVIEAMACGTPVVTSNRGSLAEVAGDAAVLVNPESVDSITAGITKALETEHSGSLRDRGLQHAEQFTWQRAATRTLQVINDAYDDL